MTKHESPLFTRRHRRSRSRRMRAAGVVLLLAACAGVVAYQELPADSSAASRGTLAGAGSAVLGGLDPRTAPPSGGGTLGAGDGAIPEGTTVFSDDVPGVTRLDPALLDALRAAANDAERDGVRFEVDSGWRSPAYQQHLLDEAVVTYGSREEAARWVASPTTSSHVSGAAVDLGPMATTDWLAQRGAAYGLCQTYGNESWHYELRPDAAAAGCPEMYADAAHNPRMG